MVTGVEIAGLVLGSFPLLIEGLKAYGDGVETIMKMRVSPCKTILDGFLRQIKVEAFNYETICEGLLYGRISTEVLDAVKANPRSSAWKSPEVQRALEKCLPQRQIDLLSDTLDDLGLILETLATKLRVVDGDADLVSITANRERFKKRALEMYTVMREETIKSKVGDMKTYIAELRDVSGQRTQQPPPKKVQSSAKSVARYYSWIRSQSLQLHGILKDNLLKSPACMSCSFQHSFSLRLIVRSLANIRNPQNGPFNLRFGISVSSDAHNQPTPPRWRWKELDLEPFEQQPVPRNDSKRPPSPDDHSTGTDTRLAWKEEEKHR